MKRDTIGALIIRTEFFGVDLYYNHNIGALTIRVGFGVYSTITTIRNPPKIVGVRPHQQKQEQPSILMLLSWRLCLWRTQP